MRKNSMYYALTIMSIGALSINNIARAQTATQAAQDLHVHQQHPDPDHNANKITAEQLLKEMKEKPQMKVVNIFEKSAFDKSHIQGSINVQLPKLEETAKAWDRATRIILYCAESDCPANKLAWHILVEKLGFKDVAIYDGGMQEWVKKGYPLTSTVSKEEVAAEKPKDDVSAEELLAEMQHKEGGLIVLNILDKEVYEDCKITFPPNVKGKELNIPLMDLMTNLAETTKGWAKNARIIVYCTSSDCPSGAMGMSTLKEGGFTNVSDFKDGMLGWYQKDPKEYPREGTCKLSYLVPAEGAKAAAPAAAGAMSWWERMLGWLKFW